MNEFGIIVIGPMQTKEDVCVALQKVNMLIDEILPEVRLRWAPSDVTMLKQTIEYLAERKIFGL